ncbi:hypothetical protein TBLA_0A10210 [Henningerozyma blattae CBS 6284]|uniref:Phospholipid scramblase n=1 Tax=Henningerozyma blattae (strain ATCC 34711 / CBS 6284 / DSM 70876 / NBRC 10599 / NRRL Y-10934 / UCD 77-7) TaxID=1071380 RepID=I2GXE8_HENB6|nr:hypothetical protein TBLA_0A10210 [Tetrapisispora blattae CBS 6284]CCH58800.1 hypothetical protein TBLA_0A10210 [Tetrapisispora blattae CBS 6284]
MLPILKKPSIQSTIFLRCLYSTNSHIIRNGSFRRIRHPTYNDQNLNSYNNAYQNNSFNHSTKDNGNNNNSFNYGNSQSATIIQPYHPVVQTLLKEPTIVIERQIEMMNIFLGYEQANKYVIMNTMGNKIGYIMERDFSISKMIMRQFSKLHRPFTVDIFDNWGNVVLTIRRPFSWINSHIKALLPPLTVERNGQPVNMHDNNGTLIGESIQSWHLWRRRYDLFTNSFKEEATADNNNYNNASFDQFGAIDAPFLSFEFPVLDQSNKVIAGVDRNWVGLGREFFTDTGVYIIRFNSQQSFEGVYSKEQLSNHVLNLDQRAVLLANAISIDFDYFSRHSRTTGGGLFTFGSYDE